MKELCENTLEKLKCMKTDASKIAEILNEPYLSDAIKPYPELIQDKYIQKKLENKFRSERKDACGNKLILEDLLYAYICPDLYAFCEWLFCGIENPKGIIPRNHVYCSFYNDDPYNKYDVVECLRSPHLYMEQGIRNLVRLIVNWIQNNYDNSLLKYTIKNMEKLCEIVSVAQNCRFIIGREITLSRIIIKKDIWRTI